MHRFTKLLCGAAFATAVTLGGTVGTGSAANSPQRFRVVENDLKDGYGTQQNNSWYREDTRPGGSVSLTQHLVGSSDGFDGPEGFNGNGALALTTNNTNYAKAQLMNHNLQGSPLGDVTALDYWTYQSSTSGSAVDAPSYQLKIDLDGDLSTTDDQTTLVYEPYWNDAEGPSPQQPLAPDVWQHWDATAGDWWSSKQITCGEFSVAPGAGGPPFTRPSEVAQNCTGAQVVAFGVNIGSYNRNTIVATDGLHIATSTDDFTYDFGPK